MKIFFEIDKRLFRKIKFVSLIFNKISIKILCIIKWNLKIYNLNIYNIVYLKNIIYLKNISYFNNF